METISNVTNGSTWNPWVYTTVVFIVVFSVLYLLRRLIWFKLARWAEKTESTWDDFVLEKVSSPLNILIGIASFGIAGQAAPQTVRTHPLMVYGVRIALILVALWILDRAVALFFRSSALPESLNNHTRTLFHTIARVFLLSIGLLIVLDTLGVSITPLLASLGVGSVAVALALQDTLSNFFGGLYLLVDKPIRLGDYAEVDGISGHVEKIGWRSTRFRDLSDNIIVVPNSKLSNSQIKNYHFPDTECGFVVQLGVAYESDLEKVERVTLEVARAVLSQQPGAVAGFEPALRFHTFADSSINFSVALRVKTFMETSTVRHEFIKALNARYMVDGITIPFPQRVVHWRAINEPGANDPARKSN